MLTLLLKEETALCDADIARLCDVARQLPLMAELSGADVFIDCARKDGSLFVAAQSAPSTAVSSYEKSVVGVKPVAPEWVQKYCSLKVEEVDGYENLYLSDDMIEKPKPGEEFSNLSILGRVLLTPDIFDIIDHLTPGAGGEYQLTDAMAILARRGGVYALEFEGERYDLGSKIGLLKANIIKGLSHPETRDELREYLLELARTL